MKKILLLTMSAMAMMLPTQSASAYTASEIAAKGFSWRALGDSPDCFRQETVKIPYFLDGEVELSVDASGDLVVSKSIPQDLYSEFGSDEVKLKITISGTKAYVNNGTFKLRVYQGSGGEYDGYGNYGLLVNELYFTRLWAASDASYFIGIFPLRNDDFPYDGKLTGNVSKDADGNFVIEFPKFEIHKLQTKRGNIHVFSSDGESYLGYGSGYQYFNSVASEKYGIGSMEFHTYTPNVTISEKVTEYIANGNLGPSYTTSYGAQMKMTDATHFYIDNWHNKGRPYTLRIPSGAVSRYNPLDKQYNRFTGSLDLSNLTIEIDPADVFCNFWIENSAGKFYYDATGEVFVRNMGHDVRYEGNDVYAESITGTIKSDGMAHKGTNTWLNRLDNITVIQSPTAYFDDYDFVDCLSPSEYFDVERVSDIEMSLSSVLGGEIEYTHDCALEIKNHGYGIVDGNVEKGNHLYIHGVIQQLKNNALVDPDGYDIYVIPAKDSYKFNDPEFFHSDGHSEATLISVPKYYYHWAPQPPTEAGDVQSAPADNEATAAAMNEGLNFCLMVPESDLNVKSPNGKYAYYIRARYKQPATRAAALGDSFHGLTEPTGDGMTGVENLVAGDDAEGLAVVDGASIVISGSEGAALVSTLDGRVVYQGGDAAVDVRPGVYVVRAGKTVTKVVVK